MNHKLTFVVQDIRQQGGLTYDGSVSDAELTSDGQAWSETFGEAALSDPCSVHLEFSVGGERILLEGKVAGRWDVICSRCLAPHKVDFKSTLEETYPLSQETLDVGEDIRQAMILSLPERSICTPSCLGLCPNCGDDLNQGHCRCREKP